MMIDTWVVFLLGNVLVACGVYITYLLREVKLYQQDIEKLVAVLQTVYSELKVIDKEDDDGTRH